MNRCNFHRLSPSRIVRGDSAAPCKKKSSATADVPSVSTRPAAAPVAGMTVASATAPIISSKKGSVFFKATTFPVQCRCCDVGQGSEASSHWSANWSGWSGTSAIAPCDQAPEVKSSRMNGQRLSFAPEMLCGCPISSHVMSGDRRAGRRAQSKGSNRCEPFAARSFQAISACDLREPFSRARLSKSSEKPNVSLQSCKSPF